MEEWNVTLNASEIYEEEVTIIQYVSLAFSAFCILPNIFTICLLIRSKLSRLAEYFIILNWSIMNIIFILNFIYLYLIPNQQIPDKYYNILYHTSTVLIISISMLVIMLNIEYVLESDKLFKNIILLVWLFGIMFVLGLFLTYFPEVVNVVHILEPLQNFSLGLLAFIFVLNLFVISLQSGKYKNYKARIILSVVFLLCYTLRWSVGNIIYDDYYALIVTIASSCLFYLNGLTNFIVLVAFDTDVKDYLSLKEEKSNDVKDVEL